tara:strand:+ start:144 stop:806 length:663 start_codon:yes stop_codon:yes gene_type:complete
MTKDYSLGKIYKIIDNRSDMFYVGSTCYPLLSQRLAKHKSHLRDYEKGYGKYVTSFEILNNDDYKIILLENYPCNNIDELKSQEQVWLDKLRCDNMVNKQNAKGLNLEKKKEYRKEYIEKNKEEIAKKSKEYRENNKEEIAQKQKEYRKNNREKLAQKFREYYKTHKEERLEKKQEWRKNNKIQCDRCNSIVNPDYFKKHRQSDKCINALPRGIINELAE